MTNKQLCTFAMARKWHTSSQSSLTNLCKNYGVSAWKREYHGALIDASMTKDLYKILIRKEIKISKQNMLKAEFTLGIRTKRTAGLSLKDYFKYRKNNKNKELTNPVLIDILKVLRSSR